MQSHVTSNIIASPLLRLHKNKVNFKNIIVGVLVLSTAFINSVKTNLVSRKYGRKCDTSFKELFAGVP